MGGGVPPGVVPVDDPVPVVVPAEVLPVDVLDDEVGWVAPAEPSGVAGVDEPGVGLDAVGDVLVGVGVTVGVVEDPPVVVEGLLSSGATGLTPPLPGAVEMPPVARTLILTGVVVVI